MKKLFALKNLKIVGLIIATFSTIWALLNIVTIQNTDSTQKVLTPEGQFSIGLSLLGLTLNIISTILEDREKLKKANENAVKELQRTRKIILAGQPLVSLDFFLKCNYNEEFDSIAKQCYRNWVDKHCSQQGETSASKGDGLLRAYAEIPLFMASIFGAVPEDRSYENFLLLISVGTNQSAILSYGVLPDDLEIYSELGHGKNIFEYRDKNLSKGILSDDDVGKGAYYGIDLNISEPRFLCSESEIVLRWSLDPISLVKCLDKTNKYINLTANLPREIKIAILYDFSSLPILSKNMTTSFGSIWYIDDNEDSDYNIYLDSKLEIIPNGIIEEKAKYTLEKISDKEIIDDNWEEIEICNALTMIFKIED